MTEDERYDLMVDEIYDLKKTILNIQTILKNEGFDDIESMIAKYKKVLFDSNEIAIYKDAQIESLTAQIKEAQEQLGKAVEDMNVMALAMRESDELSETCCFACICDAQNMPDDCILSYGECPGYDTTDCFQWRYGKDVIR